MAPFEITKKHRISSDAKQFILEERSKSPSPTTGEYLWYSVAYLPTITACLEYYLHYHVRTSDKALPEALREAVDLIESAATNIHYKLQLLVQA